MDEKVKTPSISGKNLGPILEILDSLRRETAIFMAAVGKFKLKLPRDQFMCSCEEVLRHLKFLFNTSGLKEISISNEELVNEEFITVLIAIIKQSSNAKEVSLKAFSLSEQRMRLGFFVVNYSLSLGILARIYTLVKALCLLSGRLAFNIKKKLCSEDDVQVTNFGFSILNTIGFTDANLSVLSMEELQDNFYIKEDFGEIISRVECPNVTERPDPNVKGHIPSIIEPIGDKYISKTIPGFRDIKNVKDFRLACRKALKTVNKSQKAQLKTIFSQTVKKTKEWKAKGKIFKARKELQLAMTRVTHLLQSNLQETAVRFKGYQSISDDDIEIAETSMEMGDIQSHRTYDEEIDNSGSKNWSNKRLLLKTLKSAKSVKDMLENWKAMMKGQREDLKELIPSTVSHKHRLKIKKMLSRTSNQVTIIKSKIQVRMVSHKVINMISKTITS